MEVNKLSIAKAHRGLLKKEFSASELAKEFFDRIEKMDDSLRAFLTLTKELAFTQAGAIDDKIAEGHDIPLLAGIPLVIKDNILVEGVRCTAGSKILENYIALYDATVTQKLKASGAVILGKTNLDEFAMGSSTERSAYGPTKNPRDVKKVPGGSSGGSAAAVAADMCCGALGSDTGGSIRQPASFCGVVGLKPTYGAVSRYGLIAMASSLDQIGPIAKTVEDAKIIFDIIKGQDKKDSTSIASEARYIPLGRDIGAETKEVRRKNIKPKNGSSKLILGIPKEYFTKGIDPKVEESVMEAIRKAESSGAVIEEISLPNTQYALAVYYIIMPSEVSANLARYDGIKYGYSTVQSAGQKAQSLLDVYLNSRGEGFGEEVRRRIMLGTYALSAGYYEAYYVRAQKVRTLIKRDFEKAFDKVDLILTPTTPTPAFSLGEKMADPLAMYLSDTFTIGVNLAGLPALSLPVGKVGELPVGLQIISRPFEEERIFYFAAALENIIS